MAELKLKNITEKIIGASFQVHKFIGPGFQNVIYQRALSREMDQAINNFNSAFGIKNKSVKSYNHSKSLPCWQAVVIQILDDIVKAHGGELLVNTAPGGGSTYLISLLK